MNEVKTINYTQMAGEYLASAAILKRYIEKIKSDKTLKAHNPREYNSKLAMVREMYGECIQTANVLSERAKKYEKS